nr:hypothetical protein [Lachnospiraceae bacterium]
LNAWFIVPFLDFVRRGDFIMEHTSERTIQSVGLPFSQLMGLFIRRGSDATRDHFGVLNNGQPSVGFPLVAGLLVFAVLWIKGKKVMAKWAVPVLAILGMYMSLLVFPWDAIQSFCAARPYLHSVAAFIANIQFPMRLLMPATILLTVLFCMNAGDMGSCFKEKARRGYLVVFTVLGLICGLFLTEDILQSSPYFRIYNEEGMNYGYVSGGEYLPTGSDLGRFVFGTAMPGSSDVTIAAYEKDDLEVQMQVENKGSDSFVDVPILCYPGYEAVSSHHGTLALTQGDYGQIRVEIPAGFSGDVKVGFHTPWYWIMADLVTLITMVLLAGYHFRRKPLSGETV